MANPCEDSKLGVDRPTKRTIEEVLEKLSFVDETSVDDAVEFMSENFHQPGFEIFQAHFCDWKSMPKYTENLKSEILQKFALSLNEIWLDLYKRCDHTVLAPGAVSSHVNIYFR